MQDVSHVRFPSSPLNHQICILTQRLLMEVFRLHVLSQLCLGPMIALLFSLSSCRAGKIPLCLSSWGTSLNFEVCPAQSRRLHQGPLEVPFKPHFSTRGSCDLTQPPLLPILMWDREPNKGDVTPSSSSPTPKPMPGACFSLWRKQNTNLLSLSQENSIQKEHYAQCALLLAIDQYVLEELSGNLR